MKALIVYDSAYGNTETIARTIAKGIGEEAQVKGVEETTPEELGQYEIVLVGSPTQAGRPTPEMKAFLGRIPAHSLNGVAVSGFDTRIDGRRQGFVLRTFMGFLGYAAGRIARQLQAKGGRLIDDPHGFFVEDKEGPLSEGEADRAAAWGSTIVHALAATR